jgi:hypothetical protein
MSRFGKLTVPMPVVCAYASFATAALYVFHAVADGEASSVLTMSAIAQCLGITMLVIQSLTSGSAAGISVASLVLDAFAIAFRLSSTLFVDGYLPSDKSGDYMYQSFDVCSLLLLIFLVHRVLVKQHDTYQASEDTVRVGPLVLTCLVLAVVLHGDMDDNKLLDILWLAGVFTGVVAVLPQFWLITSSGGWSGALTSHYIASLALSRFLSGCFMWMARHFITCEPYVANIEHTIIAIFFAHFVHIVLLGDFMLIYVRSLFQKGVCESVLFSVEV